jgi:hypothetical protein
MQNQTEQPSYYEKIKADYSEVLAILQELKSEQNEEKNERER